MSGKIVVEQLERAAYVYVRQSTARQVREHLEGQRRQYALAERAKELGFKEVVVIDDDLGRSGSGSQERPGFGRLLAAVCDGVVGAVFALEASRLARNNRDWHHLVDLCAMTNTVLVDADGAYDPRHLNDRLLLGLKGTMSEFELGLLRQRAQAAFLDKVRRGAAMWEVPVGFVRTEDDGIEKTPDRQVQEAIAGVFKKLRELGSLRQVAIWHHEAQLPLPHLKGATRGTEVFWRLPTANRIRQIVRNPCYAGAFAYGQRRSKTTVREGRNRVVRGERKPIEEWSVLIRDHHEGYITWHEYLRNQELLEANLAKWTGDSSGAAKDGSALMAGLLRCARCGRKLSVVYSGADGHTARYCCRGRGENRGLGACIGFGSMRVDEAVSAQILEVVRPAGVTAALAVAEADVRQEDERRKALELALEKARYQADRARRQYDVADPENRLVAAELEARWNAALTQVSELETRLRALSDVQPPLAPHERERLLALATDLPALWAHPGVSVRLKKRIARTLIVEIVADVRDDPPEVVLQLHWVGGIHTELRVLRRLSGQHRRSADRELLELVRDLARVCQDKDTARILNRLGYRTGQGQTWRASRVGDLRRYHEIPPMDLNGSWVTLDKAALALGVSNTAVQHLIRDGILPAKQIVPYAPWVIERADLRAPKVLDRVKAVLDGRRGGRRPQTDPRQQQLEF
jgi:DNA invertase Pin-like site-specific DNA recombinase